MSAVQLKLKRHKEPDHSATIFANRNTLYRRFHQIHKLKEPHDKELLQPEGNKFQLFKNRLAQYLSSEKDKAFERQDDRMDRYRRRSLKLNKKRSYQSSYLTAEGSDDRLKLSFIRYLRSNSQESGLDDSKKSKSKTKPTKIRIHTNLPEKCHKIPKKRSITDNDNFIHERSKTTESYFVNAVNNRMVPVCTINFVDLRKTTSANPSTTVYNSYLHTKLGFNWQELRQEQIKSSESDKVFNFKTNKAKTVLNQQINQGTASEVLIMDGTEQNVAELQRRKDELLRARNIRHTPKPVGIKIHINNAKDVDNLLGPWSKKGLIEEDQEYNHHP